MFQVEVSGLPVADDAEAADPEAILEFIES